MKYVKKFNEDNSSFEFDEEYIKECFIEFFDDPDKYDVYAEGDTTTYYIEHGLGINCPDLEIEERYNIEDFIKISKEVTDFYVEVNVCIEKVKIKYPDVDVVIFQDNHEKGQGSLTGTRFIWVKFRKSK